MACWISEIELMPEEISTGFFVFETSDSRSVLETSPEAIFHAGILILSSNLTAALEKAELESQASCERLREQLNIDNDVAEVLVEEGFLTPEEVAYVPVQELVEIEGFDQELVEQLRRRAKEFLDIREFSELEKTRPEDDLLSMEGMDDETARLFAQNGVRSMEELAECATDELVELSGIDEERAAELIMTARAPWFAEAQ